VGDDVTGDLVVGSFVGVIVVGDLDVDSFVGEVGAIENPCWPTTIETGSDFLINTLSAREIIAEPMVTLPTM